jgi:hypothetical protein
MHKTRSPSNVATYTPGDVAPVGHDLSDMTFPRRLPTPVQRCRWPAKAGRHAQGVDHRVRLAAVAAPSQSIRQGSLHGWDERAACLVNNDNPLRGNVNLIWSGPSPPTTLGPSCPFLFDGRQQWSWASS